ncbi:MAG: hypothetical protein PHG51_03695, partial [Candidatus Omnitrophica bacterium]|nr:hypothetical protein [Candidatus Omnitrophota bacterium]
MIKRNLIKKLTVLSGIMFFLLLLLPKTFAAESLKLPNPAATISMDFKDANLKDVLKVFSMQSGLNFVASQAVQNRTVTLYLDKVPVMACMDNLFKANNLSYEKDPSSNIIIVTDWGQPSVQTITKAYTLKYNRLSNCRIDQEINNYLEDTTELGASTGGLQSSSGGSSGGGTSGTTVEQDEGISKSIKKLLTQYGKLTEDRRANCLVVTDIPSNFPVIEDTIRALDVAVPQVMLEIEMLDVNKSKADNIGFKYGQTPFTAIIKGASFDTAWPFTRLPVGRKWKALGDDNFAPGSISVNGTDATAYQVQFDFLRTLTDTKFLARPRVLTLSNETAEIRITTNESIGVSTTSVTTAGTTSSTAERASTGVLLRITPQVNAENGDITMFVM